VSIFGYGYGYQVHIERGFRSGLSSRTSPAETIRFNLRARSFSNNSNRVLPSFNTTLNRESGCTRIPNLPRPLISKRLYCFGPLVTQASAWQGDDHIRIREKRGNRKNSSYQRSSSGGRCLLTSRAPWRRQAYFECACSLVSR
jgi:hypothetical protein